MCWMPGPEYFQKMENRFRDVLKEEGISIPGETFNKSDYKPFSIYLTPESLEEYDEYYYYESVFTSHCYDNREAILSYAGYYCHDYFTYDAGVAGVYLVIGEQNPVYGGTFKTIGDAIEFAHLLKELEGK